MSVAKHDPSQFVPAAAGPLPLDQIVTTFERSGPELHDEKAIEFPLPEFDLAGRGLTVTGFDPDLLEAARVPEAAPQVAAAVAAPEATAAPAPPAPEAKPVAPPAPATAAPKPSISISPPPAAAPKQPALPAAAQAKPATEKRPPAGSPAKAPGAKPAITVRPEPAKPAIAPKPSTAEPRRSPAIAARDHGNAVPAQLEPVVRTAPPKPKVVPISKEPVILDEPALGMPLLEPSPLMTFWTNAPLILKGGVAAAAAAIMLGGATFLFRDSSPAGPVVVQPVAGSALTPITLGGGGWAANWGSDEPANKDKQIAIFRPSVQVPDYRIEFRGQIEKKALGWIFRARDPKNYYVMKLEAIKPGVEPVIALVKYAVINGKESTHTQIMLPMKASMTTVFKVRTDVTGKKFTTWVQDQLVDYWNDDRIRNGGAGFYTDKGERAQIHSSQIAALK